MIKVLVIDDSTIQRNALVRALNQRQDINEIVQAENGQEGIELVKNSNDYDLIITDFNMPVMNGLDMVRFLKSEEAFSHIPIIIISAEVSKENMLDAIVAGADMEILKPFSDEDLSKSIDYVLKIPKNSDAPSAAELLKRVKYLEEENKELKEKIKTLTSGKYLS